MEAPPDPMDWKIRAAIREPADFEYPPPREARVKINVETM